MELRTLVLVLCIVTDGNGCWLLFLFWGKKEMRLFEEFYHPFRRRDYKKQPIEILKGEG